MAEACSSRGELGEFVGRTEDLQCLSDMHGERNREGHQKYMIYGIHGTKGIGKSALMMKFIQVLTHNHVEFGQTLVGTFDFDELKSFRSFLDHLCDWYKVQKHKWKKSADDDEDTEEEFYDCMHKIAKKMKNSPHCRYLVFLDNMETACARKDGSAADTFETCLWDKVYKHFVEFIIPKCKNVLVFITSTQTAKFSKFNGIACSRDLMEMTKEDGIKLMKMTIGSKDIKNENVSPIVEMCDGLPSSIVRVGAMLSNGDFTLDEIACILQTFENKMYILSNEYLPLSERMDKQLKGHLQRMTNENRANLRSLAKMIPADGNIPIQVAARQLEPGMNLAIFKLRFLLPLSFRGMVTVDKKTGDISMNPTFQKFVLMPEGKHDLASSVELDAAVNTPYGGYRNGCFTANQASVPSQITPDNSSCLLEKDTVSSQRTQDGASHQLETCADTETLPANVAKMEGQRFGADDKVQSASVQTHDGQNNLSDNSDGEPADQPEGKGRDIIHDKIEKTESESSSANESKELSSLTTPSMITSITKETEGNAQICFSGTSRNAIKIEDEFAREEHTSLPAPRRRQRSNTLEENTMTANEKDTVYQVKALPLDTHTISLEENDRLPSANIPAVYIEEVTKPLNRTGSLEENEDQDLPMASVPPGKSHANKMADVSLVNIELENTTAEESDTQHYDDKEYDDETNLPHFDMLLSDEITPSSINPGDVGYDGETRLHNTNGETSSEPSTTSSSNPVRDWYNRETILKTPYHRDTGYITTLSQNSTTEESGNHYLDDKEYDDETNLPDFGVISEENTTTSSNSGEVCYDIETRLKIPYGEMFSEPSTTSTSNPVRDSYNSEATLKTPYHRDTGYITTLSQDQLSLNTTEVHVSDHVNPLQQYDAMSGIEDGDLKSSITSEMLFGSGSSYDTVQTERDAADCKNDQMAENHGLQQVARQDLRYPSHADGIDGHSGNRTQEIPALLRRGGDRTSAMDSIIQHEDFMISQEFASPSQSPCNPTMPNMTNIVATSIPATSIPTQESDTLHDGNSISNDGLPHSLHIQSDGNPDASPADVDGGTRPQMGDADSRNISDVRPNVAAANSARETKSQREQCVLGKVYDFLKGTWELWKDAES